jgi:type I restriction enzyme S subunit
MTNLSGTNLNNGAAVGPQGEGRDCPSTFPKYPAYKDSGVKWLSDVPQHWNVRRNKQVFRLVSVQVGNKSADFRLLSLTLRGVIPRDMESGKGKFPAEFDTYQVVEPDDIVFCLFDIDETPRTVGISSDFGMITGAYTVAKTLPVADPRFIYYYYFSIDLRKGLRPFYTGLRKVVRPETFLNIELPLPPLSEQANICNFLDHETGKIDGLIAEQEKLIELLKEKRQALALQAYLECDSLELRLGHAVTVIARPVQYEPDQEYVALGIYNRGRGLFHKEPKPQNELGDSDFFVIEEGDLIISGQFAWEGSVAMAGSSEAGTIVSHRYPVIRGKASVCLTEYIYALLTTWEGDFLLNECSRGAAGRNRPLNIGALLKEKIKIPSMSLQHKIARFVHEEKNLLSEIQTTIKLLEERRSALISAAVTGKIDVRNWKPEGEAA